MEHSALEAIWEHADRPVLALEPDGASCRAVYENAAARRLCPGGVLSLLPPQERADLAAILRRPEASPGPLFCHAGPGVYAALLMRWQDACLCILQDATAYYHDNQRALREAILANQAKTSFLSEMSHDIRTPMGAIIGLTEIALGQPESPPRVRDCLEKIKVASGHMMSLLNEVLDMSRIESGRVVIQPAPVNVGDLLHEVLTVVRPQAEGAGLRFSLDLGPVVREHILADGVRLKQICLNLLSNAVKYTPAGGQVQLFFSIRPDSQPGQVRMTVRVTDSGIGMSPEFLQKLFTPFEREEKSTVSKIQGTGLGMAITKNLVELMGGSIQVESQPDRGSTFTVELPFEAPEDSASFQALAGRRVLLLESRTEQGRAVKKLLESLYVETDWAQDADAAVYLLNDADLSGGGYLALLAAEGLPNVDLMLFLPQLRKRMGEQFPILLLSENDWSQTEYLFTRAGVSGFLPLPLFRSRLASELLSWAGQGGCPRRPEPVRRDFSQRRLLLVEDNELNREIVLDLLGESGIAIDTAEHGAEAVERFQDSPLRYYDMILMDIQMPVMNGLDATRAIRALDRPDAGEVPIVAMTANAFAEDVRSALEAGMNAHLAKPLDMDKVFAAMEQFWEGGAP